MKKNGKTRTRSNGYGKPSPTGNSPGRQPRLIIGSKGAQRASLRIAALRFGGVPFRHAPLDHNVASIRLVQVLPKKSPSGLIQCSLHHTTIEDATYICLSYEWGLTDQVSRISINNQPYHVGQNLLDFLQIARRKLHSKPLWIDALCIDQMNVTERNHQVQLMGMIYSEATEVLAWLGDDATIAKLFTISTRKQSDRRTRETRETQIGMAYVPRKRVGKIDIEFEWGHMCRNSYWTRAWITQEIALARKVWLLAKDRMIEELRLPRFDIPLFSKVRHLGRKRKSLIYLLHHFHDKKCKVKRDRIFSLLSLCGEGSDLKVDYSISNADVMLQTLEACNKSMCFCSVAIVAGALALQRAPEREVIIRDIQINPIKHYLGDVYGCSRCPRSIGLEWTRMVGHLFCLGSICPDHGMHFFWEKSPSGRMSRFYIVETGLSTNYLASFQGSSDQGEDGKFCIRLPLQMLLDVEQWRMERVSAYRNVEHLSEEKGLVRFHDRASGMPPGQCLRVMEIGEKADVELGDIGV